MCNSKHTLFMLKMMTFQLFENTTLVYIRLIRLKGSTKKEAEKQLVVRKKKKRTEIKKTYPFYSFLELSFNIVLLNHN